MTDVLPKANESVYAYDLTTGRIMFSANAPVQPGLFDAIRAMPGHGVVVGVTTDISKIYVKSGKVKDRPVMAPAWKDGISTVAADGTSFITLTGLPADTRVYVDHMDAGLYGPTFDVTAEHPGTYSVYLENFPYMEKVITFTAT